MLSKCPMTELHPQPQTQEAREIEIHSAGWQLPHEEELRMRHGEDTGRGKG